MGAVGAARGSSQTPVSSSMTVVRIMKNRLTRKAELAEEALLGAKSDRCVIVTDV